MPGNGRNLVKDRKKILVPRSEAEIAGVFLDLVRRYPMHSIRTRLAALVAALILTTPLVAQSSDVGLADQPEEMQKLLAATARHYREAKSLRIERDITGVVDADGLTSSEKMREEIVLAPGNRYRLEIKQAWGWSIEESDGKTEWSWYPWRKQYVEKPVEHPPENAGFISFLRQLDKKLASGRIQPPQTIEVDHRKANCMVIIGPPSPRRPDPGMQMDTTYWIDRDRKILVKEQARVHSTIPEHKYESSHTTTYSGNEFDTSFPDSLFKFVPPADAARVEKTDWEPVELVGKSAPPLKLKTLDGKDFDLHSLQGRPVIVDFWATWCVPCRESMPHLAKLNDDFKESGLAVVSVSKDDDPADAARFVAKNKYSWVHVADPKWGSDLDWGPSAIPRLVLIGKNGVVLFESSDGLDKAEEAKIRTALSEMGAGSAAK